MIQRFLKMIHMIERAEAAFEHPNPETFECSSKIFREVNRVATITFCHSLHIVNCQIGT